MEKKQEQEKRDKGKQQQQDGQDKEKKNWLEWIVFAVALVLVLGILGYLGYQTYIQVPSSPDLVVEIEPDPSANAPNRYHVMLYNKGGATAENVIMELALMKNGKEMEKAQLEISFAPEESKREGWVGFTGIPTQADTVVTRVISFKKP